MPEVKIKNGEQKKDWKKKYGRHTGASKWPCSSSPRLLPALCKPAGVTTPEDTRCALWFLRLGILPLRRQSMPPDWFWTYAAAILQASVCSISFQGKSSGFHCMRFLVVAATGVFLTCELHIQKCLHMPIPTHTLYKKSLKSTIGDEQHLKITFFPSLVKLHLFTSSKFKPSCSYRMTEKRGTSLATQKGEV